MDESKVSKDLVAQLPHEIFGKIIVELPVDALCECSMVNHIWRDTILDYSSPWHTIQITQETNPLLFGILPKVCQYVRRLEVLRLKHGVSEKVAGLISQNNFDRLQVLNFRALAYEQLFFLRALSVSPDTTSKLCCALLSIKSTLRELTLQLAEYPGAPSLSWVLSSCRNLIALQYHSSNRGAFSGLSSLPFTTTLTKLSLPDCTYMDPSELSALLRVSPHLRRLRLDGCQFDPFSAVSEALCNLKYLAVNCNGTIYGNPGDRRDDACCYRDGGAKKQEKRKEGLCSLALGALAPTRSLASFLGYHCKSINALCFSVIRDENYLMLNDVATALQLPVMHNLRTIRVQDSSAVRLWRNMPDIIRACPNLTAFEVVKDRIVPYEEEDDDLAGQMDGIVESIVDMNAFSKLRISRSDLNATVPMCLLYGYSRAGPECALDELEISHCETDDVSVMLQVANIQSLRNLKVHNVQMPVPDTLEFIQAVANLPQLEHLDIKGDNFFVGNDATIRCICQSTSLRSIHLDDDVKLTVEEKHMLRDRFVQEDRVTRDATWLEDFL
ncbi:hypothetical protein BDB00DRAFT_803643 [Zychaea mexicana]|uniref:uncharacterized protein n=1 Tax=Zychaea mexicana TaxID=64656 RepID=UPI0022FE59CD|nr:uncharacterized protein BDB00DRAFT_803643 [Zychaea mexicana]KAI9497695.1 hypothetical protein BDB00DRAFT_803643 [Zychaea mexicana]